MSDRLKQLELRFGSEPLGKLLDARLEFLAPGHARLSAKARDEFLIVGGFVQGGVTTALADYAAVYAAMSVIPDGHTPAMQISIQFVRPVGRGEEVTVEASVVDQTRTTVATSFDVLGSDGKRKAFGTALFAKPRTA